VLSYGCILKNNNAGVPLTYVVISSFFALLIVILTIVAASGMVYIPVLTDLMGTDKAIDLGVEVDPVIFDGLVQEQGINLADPASAYTLTSDIIYSDAAPMEISLSSSQLSSYLQATNNEGPMKDIQVRLGSNNQAEMSAYIDLKEFGYDFKGPVYAQGTFAKASDNSIRVDVSSAKVGILPVPEGTAKKGQQELESLINSHLSKMGGLNIESLEVEDGNLNFKGDFPRTFEVAGA
jgi:hypothetical protein